MAFYKIIANSIDNKSDGKQSYGQKRLIGHINSEQIGNKYVYVIQFDHNFDCNQPFSDCCLQSVTKTNEIDFKSKLNINFNVKSVADLEQQIINYNNNCFNAYNYDNQITNQTIDDQQSSGPAMGDVSNDQQLICDEQMIDENELNFDSVEDESEQKYADNEDREDREGTDSQLESDRPFLCLWPHCNKRFNRKGILNTHMRIHTGERPFLCDWPDCGKSFNQVCVLTNHKRTHTGERPYACDYVNCGQSFKTSGSLHHHRNNHQKPYKKFHKINAKTNPNEENNENNETINNSIDSQSSDASDGSDSEKCTFSSELAESGEEKNPYECGFDDCGQRFARKCALINHLSFRHSDDSY